MQPENLGGVHAERTVHVDREGWQPAGLDELVQRVNEQLRSAHRERRDDHLAAVVQCAGEQRLDLVRQTGVSRVLAVAVGAFDEQHVDVLDRFRVAQNRVAAAADVAAEQQPAFCAAFVDVEDDLC